MRNFRELKVWQKGHALTLAVYRITKSYPRDERFGLTSQTRRAAASIGANIAEGSCRRTNPDFAHFLQIAMGSASELDYHLLLARDLGYLPQADYPPFEQEVSEVKRMLTVFIQKLLAPQLDS